MAERVRGWGAHLRPCFFLAGGGAGVGGSEIGDAVRSLVERGTFAVLAVLTWEGDVVLRPVGGRWGAGIADAIREMAERYPGCRMRLFERPYDDWDLYFKHVVGREQVL